MADLKRPKRVLTKEEFDSIQKPLQSLYIPQDDKYVMDLEDYEEPEALLRAKNYEKDAKNKVNAQRIQLEKDKAALEEKLSALDDENKQTQSVLAQKDSQFQKQLDELKNNFTAKEQAQIAKLEKTTLEKVVKEVGSWFTNDEAGQAIATTKAKTFYENDEVVVKFPDAQGNYTLTNLEDVRKNFLENEKLKTILKGKNSSGGGANNTTPSAVPTKKFEEMTIPEKLKLSTENLPLYLELDKQSKQKQ